MAADLTALVQRLSREVRGVQGALVLGPDGAVLAQAWRHEPPRAGSTAGACAALVSQMVQLAREGDLGSPRRFGLHGERGQLVLARAPGGLTVGVVAAPTTLGGELRRHLDEILSSLERT